MIITKDTPLSAIEYNNEDKIYITKEVSLDKHLMKLLLSKFPQKKFIIKTTESQTYSNIETDVLYNNEELQILVENTNLARTEFGKDITFEEDFSITQAIEASNKMNEWADMINNATINGEPLSPLEKFTMAYSLVTNRLYQSANEESPALSRNLISVLSSDYIVCVGFANVLSNLCSRIGIPCAFRECAIKDINSKDKIWENHANCIVRIEDCKYNVHGFFNSDPTWDIVNKKEKDESADFNIKFKHFLIPHTEYKKYFPNIVLDKAVLKSESNSKTQTKNIVEIQNLDSLFPDLKKEFKPNNIIFNNQTHDLNYETFSQLIFHELVSHYLNTPDNFNHAQLNKENEQDMIESIINFFIQKTLDQEQNSNVPAYIDNMYLSLNSAIPKNELLNKFNEALENFDKQKLIEAYLFEINKYSKKNNYVFYKYYYDIQKANTKALDKQTLKSLFGNMLPFLFNTYKLDSEILDEFLSNFTPLNLENKLNQKAQE